ncbi:MAG: glycosyltransferase [Sphingobacterium sp.]
MRLLCVIDSLGSGGAQRQLIELAIGFKYKYDFKVTFLIYHQDLFYKDLLDRNGIDVVLIEESSYFKRLLRIRRFIRKGDFDNVISFLEAASFICEISGFPTRKWGLIVGERSANPLILKSPKLRLYRFFHLFSDYVVANSNENIEMVKRINPLLSDSKLKVIYNIVDLEKWQPSNLSNDRNGNKKFNLVVIASLRRLKNLRGLIEGVKLLGTKAKSLKVTWYGDSVIEPFIDESFPQDLMLIDKYNLQDVFEFRPATLSINEEIKSADAVGLFSLYEGLPNAVCEAMASGKTVLSSKISDVSCFIKNRELLFNPNIPSEINGALENLLSLNVARLNSIGRKNRIEAEKLFSQKAILESYLKLMKKG